MAEQLQQALSQLEEVCKNQTDPKIFNAMQTVVNSLSQIRNSQKIRNSIGNLSPNVNSANDNTVTSANVGEASASYQSPASDNAVNTAEIQDCVSSISPFVESPIVVTTMNNCIFNSIVVNDTKAKANVDQQHINSNLNFSNLQTWMPFINKLDEAGFTDTAAIISLLQKYEGNCAAVLKELVANN